MGPPFSARVRLALCATLGLGLLSCSDPAATVVTPPSLVVAPNTVEEWLGEQVTVVATLPPDAPRTGEEGLHWTISDTSVLAIVGGLGTTMTVSLKAFGSAYVIARVGDLRDSALIRVKREGDLITRFDFLGNTYSNGIALDRDGRVYMFNERPGQLIALGADLSLRWVRSIGIALVTPLVGADGNIYFNSGRLSGAFSPEGQLLWQDSAGSLESATTMDAAGNSYSIDDVTGRVTRYDATGGATVLLASWTARVKVAPVLLQDSILIITDRSLRIFALTTSGRMLWIDTLPTIVSLYLSPAVARDGRTLYVSSGGAGAKLYAVDGLTGAVVRSVTLPGGSRFTNAGAIVGADGVIYVQTEVNLVALRPDLSTLWRADSLGYDWGIVTAGGPALASGGTLYVACGTTICAVRTANGSVRWRARLPSFAGLLGPITIAPDSSIIVNTIGYSNDNSPILISVFKLRGRALLADAPWPIDGGDIARTRRARMP